MPLTLDQRLRAISPRHIAPPPHRAGTLIWLAAIALFVALLAQAFVQTGIGAWSVGVAYILYDTALLLFVARQTGGMSRLVPALPPAGGALTTTVVVAAYNEAPVLEATIAALRRQSPPPDQILIADDGSDDATPAVLASLFGFALPAIGSSVPSLHVPGLRWLRLARGGKARALNVAIAQLDTDLVLTVDADTLLEPGALAAMLGAFESEPALAAATGVLHPICSDSMSGRIFQWFQTYEYVRNFLSRYAWMQTDSLLLVSGAFACFRRDALIAVGGFDPDSLVEDYEVMHRMHRYARDRGLGWTVRVIGAAQASTDSPGSLMPFLRQRRRWFAGFLQTQYWNRDMIGNRRFGALGTVMLPVKALDSAQPLYGLAAFGLLLAFVASGSFAIAFPILIATLAKIVIDLAYLLWSLRRYRQWTGHRIGAGGALLAALLEPFTFQLLRHLGAAWGWVMILRGRQVWGASARGGVAARIDRDHDRAIDQGGGA